MPRKKPSDLPARLHFKNGGYHYVQKNSWELLSRNKQEAIELAEALNAAGSVRRLEILAKARSASEQIRQRIFERDCYRCAYCGSGENLGIDHIVPWSAGGATAPFNLVLACIVCNTSKGESDPREFIATLGLRAQIIRHEALLLDSPA